MDIALRNASTASAGGSTGGNRDRGLFGNSGSDSQDFMSLLGQLPMGLGGDFAQQARDLQRSSNAQAYENGRGNAANEFQAFPGSVGGPAGPGIPGMGSLDPVKTAAQIYPILEFRDRIVKAISKIIERIPGLEALVEKISETLTMFVLSLLAPFIRPIIDAVSDSLKKGSSTVVEASADSQFEPWNDPHSSNPTHSMLSKDHFSNILNPCAGRVASTILQYVAP